MEFNNFIKTINLSNFKKLDKLNKLTIIDKELNVSTNLDFYTLITKCDSIKYVTIDGFPNTFDQIKRLLKRLQKCKVKFNETT